LKNVAAFSRLINISVVQSLFAQKNVNAVHCNDQEPVMCVKPFKNRISKPTCSFIDFKLTTQNGSIVVRNW